MSTFTLSNDLLPRIHSFTVGWLRDKRETKETRELIGLLNSINKLQEEIDFGTFGASKSHTEYRLLDDSRHQKKIYNIPKNLPQDSRTIVVDNGFIVQGVYVVHQFGKAQFCCNNGRELKDGYVPIEQMINYFKSQKTQLETQLEQEHIALGKKYAW